jgi:hypothetical protein
MNVMQENGCVEYCSPIRNRYFYGKLLDVFHFELEQNYFNTKRWLLNRFVSGYGVVRGMNVLLGPDGQSVYVTPGLAIDKCGREIIICQQSAPVPLPPPPPTATGGSGMPPENVGAAPGAATATTATGDPTNTDNCGCGKFVHLLLCYLECPTDPVPAFGGDCDTQAVCSPGAIHERYQLKIVDGRLDAARTTSALTTLFSNGTFNYKALSDYVRGLDMQARGCDCCIPLANIQLPLPGKSYTSNNIDTSVGPIVYSNDLLYEMILALNQGPSQLTSAKP